MSKGYFGVTGDEYWTAPWKNLEKIAWDALVDRTAILAIDAPDFVPLGERKTLPLLVYHSADTLELARNPFRELAVITLVNLEGNRLYAQRLERATAPKQPSGPPAPGFAGVEHLVQLTELFNLPWERSSYVVTALVRDKTSNRVTVQLGSSASAYADPEVEKFIEAQRAKKPPRALFPSAGNLAVRYGAHEGSVAVPAEVGIAMRVERVVVAKPGAGVWLEVGFRLPVTKTDVLPPPKLPPGKDDPPAVTAHAVVSILVFGSDSNVPRPVPCVVASFDKVEGSPEAPVATGQFSLDLAKLAGLVAEPQTFFVYAFSGEVMAGPAIVALVVEKLLPPLT